MLPLLLRAFQIAYESNGAPPGAPPAPAAPPADPPPAPAVTPPPAGDPAPPAEGPKTFDEAYVKGLREEAAKYRTQFQAEKQKTDVQLKAIAKALGLEEGDPLDPAKLQEQLSKTQQENRDLRVGFAVQEAARKHGADVDLLVPYLKGSNSLDQLDPASATFSKDLSELVKNLVERNPKLKASQVPPRSGGEFPGGQGAPQQLTRDQLRGMSPEQIETARKAGQLDALLNRAG